MAGPTELITDDTFVTPWTGSPHARTEQLFPHLVIAAMFPEVARVGQSLCVDQPCFFGRGESGKLPRAELVGQRPGVTQVFEPLENPALSRRQLLLTPTGDGRIHVENDGRRELYHNGRLRTSCTAAPGDTLMVRDVAVFLVESRPRELRALGSRARTDFAFGMADPFGMVGESVAAWALRDQLAAVGAADAHVLIQGETGVGKELAARAVHGQSPRWRGEFVARNAATVPDTLIDVELFGAVANFPNHGTPARIGLIARAHRGTLFLDEIGELPEGHQAHVLRVMDTGGSYHLLGDSIERFSDVLFIAATNRELTALKHDLLARFPYRIFVPSLRERRSDIPLLVRDYLARRAAKRPELLAPFNASGHVLVEPRLVEALLRHPYSENTRELHRILEVAIASSQESFLALTPAVQAEMAGQRLGVAETSEAPAASDSTVDVESYGRKEVEAALARAGSVSGAAALLSVNRHALYRYMKRHGVAWQRD